MLAATSCSGVGVVGRCGSQDSALDSHRTSGGGCSSDKVASRFQEAELRHVTLGALSNSGLEGVEPQFFKPAPALSAPESVPLFRLGEGSFSSLGE